MGEGPRAQPALEGPFTCVDPLVDHQAALVGRREITAVAAECAFPWLWACRDGVEWLHHRHVEAAHTCTSGRKKGKGKMRQRAPLQKCQIRASEPGRRDGNHPPSAMRALASADMFHLKMPANLLTCIACCFPYPTTAPTIRKGRHCIPHLLLQALTCQ